MSENSPEVSTPTETLISVADSNVPEEHLDINVPHGGRRRRRRHRNSSRRSRHQKTIRRFGTTQIILGVICVTLQMIHFTNNSILSESQPGLWSGTFFVITGSVCLGLAKTSGLYSTLAMLIFCLVSLFMALTLSSLSWFGAEAASYCEYIADTCSASPPGNDSTIQLSTTLTVSYFSEGSQSFQDKKEKSELTCDDLDHHYCGFNISLARSLHSILVLVGVVGATVSFILATLACSRPPERQSNHLRHSIFTLSNAADGEQPTSVRPITAWEFPPPSKNPLPLSNSLYPDEPPPPYEEGTIVDSSYM